MLGAVVTLAGFCCMILLMPSLGARVFPYFAGIGLLSEVWLTLYLLTRDAKVAELHRSRQ